MLAASLAAQQVGDFSGTGAATSAGHLNYADTERSDVQALPRPGGSSSVELRSLRPLPAGAPEAAKAILVPDVLPAPWTIRPAPVAFPSRPVLAGPAPRPYDAHAPPRARA